MTKKILPSQLTYEELVAMLDSEDIAEPTSEITEYTNDIVPFLTNYGITPGDMPVSKKLLYRLYKTYSKAPVENFNFQLKVGEYISDRNETYYFINKDNFAISKHIYQETKKKDKTKSLVYQKHFQWFIKEREIERGSKWLEGFVLFYIYKTFCKERKVHPKLGYKSFHNFLKLHFNSRRINGNRSLWFRVDHKTYELLSEEERNVITEARKK